MLIIYVKDTEIIKRLIMLRKNKYPSDDVILSEVN
jgi:hypothetical protein